MEKSFLKIILIIVVIELVGFGGYFVYDHYFKKEEYHGKKDDWEFDTSKLKEYDSSYGGKSFSAGNAGMAMESASMSNDTIGFSVGGAKDINNFRENVKNGYFPISTDITYNGMFYDYSFDTGRKEESKELFSPSYSLALSKDPISNENELYMTVGLNSNIKESDFQRKKLNLVVVLDISGSMTSPFNSYYYDRFVGNEKKTNEDNKTKMQIANESVNILLDQLKDDDRFGMVLFESQAYLGKKLSLISETNMPALKNHILEVGAMGGTNFEAGYTMGTGLFDNYLKVNTDEYENRIIVITDAMPNYGNTSDEGLMKYVKENANKGIYTTFIGVGVDFNTKLVEAISDVRGANYYSVHDSASFKSRMGEEFAYMVTPLVFDLELKMQSDNYEIVKVYGSDTLNKENGSIMKVNTLFPSKTNANKEVKGGIILLKLKRKNQDNNKITLTVSYKDRNRKEHQNSQEIKIDLKENTYENSGIRKAIVLTRYVNAIKNWILYERTGEKRFIIVPNVGIMDCDYKPDEIRLMLGEQERSSVSLKVSEEYKDIFKKLKEYIQEENKEIKDETLNKEIEILDKLIIVK